MKSEDAPCKSAANREKHGIGFDEAQTLWDDPCLIVAPANVTGEPRVLAVARIGATALDSCPHRPKRQGAHHIHTLAAGAPRPCFSGPATALREHVYFAAALS